MKFNPSLLKVWQKCSLQAFFQEISELPRIQNSAATFGTVIHDALEYYNDNNNDLDGATSRFLDHWDNPEKLGVAIDTWTQNRTFAGERLKGQHILKEYDEKNKWAKRKVIATEHRFCVPFGSHELSGIVDLLEIVPGKKNPVLKIVDFKSNSRAPTKYELAADCQFTAYLYASMQKEFWTGVPGSPKYVGFPNGEEMYEAYRDVPRRAIWYHLNGNKEIDAGTRDDNDYMRLYRVCNEIEKAVENDVYVPTIAADTCRWCPFQSECAIVIPIKSLLDTETVRDDEESAL